MVTARHGHRQDGHGGAAARWPSARDVDGGRRDGHVRDDPRPAHVPVPRHRRRCRCWPRCRPRQRRSVPPKRSCSRPRERCTRAPAAPDPMHDLLQIDPIELEVGYALIPLIDEAPGGRPARAHLAAAQAGGAGGRHPVPPIRIRDDIRLPANEYVIKLRGSKSRAPRCCRASMMALNTGGVMAEIDGMDTIDPSFGMPARWIASSRRAEAEALGYVVVEPATVVATHLIESLKGSAAELLGRQDVQEMVETLKKSPPRAGRGPHPGQGLAQRAAPCAPAPAARAGPHPRPRHDSRSLGDGAEADQGSRGAHRSRARSLTNVIARLFADQTGARTWHHPRRTTRERFARGSSRRAVRSRRRRPAHPRPLAGMLRDLNNLATTTRWTGARCRSSRRLRCASACAASSNRCCPACRSSRSPSCPRRSS
jgi:flagellar biosynthesis protein FlhA